MSCTKSCAKIFAMVIVVMAVLLAVLASILPQERLDYIIVVSRFFDIMVPVLAVGALVKYICSCPAKSCGCGPKDEQCKG
jgi:hypothetical protein